MKIIVKKFGAFNEDNSFESMGEAINEGLFDKLKTLYSKITNLFKDKEKLTKAVQATVTDAGDKAKTFSPKQVKVGATTMVVLGDGKASATDFSIAFTKLADMADGSGLFQITGTTSPEMLKALTGTDKEEDLALNSIMALVSATSFIKGKPATIKLLKNMLPGGKDYLTKALFMGAVPGLEIEKKLTTIK
jgi:hypothetical protein